MRNADNEIIQKDVTLSSSNGVADTQTKQDPVKGEKVALVVQNISVRSNDRSTKDVATWRAAHIAAESVYTPNRSRLYDVYEDVMLDGHLTGIIGKRIDSVLNKKLLFKKGDKPVPEMEKVINSKTFRDIVTAIMESKLWGISGLEFQPGEKMWFKRIPRKHIKPKWQIITMEEFSTEGVSYSNLSNVWIIGDPEDLGLLLKCGFYALLKKGTITDWAEYIEMFGSPIVDLSYDAGDRQTEQALDKLIDEMGNSTRIKRPKQAGFEIHDGKASNGDGKLQDTFRQAMNQEMSIIVLGNTETTSASKSSGYAQSKTHENQQVQVTKSDMFDVLDYLNSDHFLNILKSYGHPVEGGMFEYDREIDIAYMEAKAAVDKVVINEIGLPVGKEYLYNTYAIDEPEEGDELTPNVTVSPVEPPQEPPAASPKKPARKPKPAAENLADETPPSPLERAGERSDPPVTMSQLKSLLTDFFGPAL